MAESYSVKAILSAQDKGFTSAFKSAMSSANSLKNTLTSGLGFGIMAGIGQKALGTITSGIGGMVSELNSSSAAWKTFNGNMSMLGKGADEISSVKKELQEFAEDTIYSASDMASTYAQLSAVGIKSTNKLVKGFGGLAAAAENPKQAMKTLSQQATQMAAKPTVAWADFKLMIEQTPAGIAAVAKEMGMSTTELVQNVQAGTIATEDFFDAIAKVGTNDAFTKLATEYKTVDQAMDGLTETVSNKLAPSFDVLSGRAIKSLDGIINKFGEMDGDAIAGKLTSFFDKASGYWNVLKTEASEVKTAFGDAFSAIGKDLGKVTGAFGSTESISSFAGVMDSASGALQTFAGFLEDHSKVIAKVIPQIPKLVVAYKGFKIVKSVAPFVGVFTSAIAGLAGAGISKIAGKLFGISKGQEAVGKSSASSSKKMMASAKSFMMLGTGVALISAGFFLLAQGAKAVANSGPLAVGVLAGLVAVVAGLGIGMMKMLSTMSGGTKKLAAMSKAMIAFGASLLMVSAAFYVLSSAAINLASAGPLAIGVMVGMVAAIAGLMIVAKMVGPALTAGAVGLLAFGAAVLVAAAGMMLLTTASISLANAGPLAVGVMFGLIVAIGALMVVAAAVGPALTAASIGLVAFGAAALLVGVGALLAGSCACSGSCGTSDCDSLRHRGRYGNLAIISCDDGFCSRSNTRRSGKYYSRRRTYGRRSRSCFGGGSSYCDSSRYDVVSSRNIGTWGRTFTCCIQYHDRGSGASACGGRRFIGCGRIYGFDGGISSTRCINVATYNVLYIAYCFIIGGNSRNHCIWSSNARRKCRNTGNGGSSFIRKFKHEIHFQKRKVSAEIYHEHERFCQHCK